jgi:2-C-methyl-D-erythritol 4-phosphate cytidylyltransferase
MESIRFAVIIPAAGSGSRSGRSIPKQYVELLGEPVLTHTLRAFAAVAGCMEIVVAIDEGWRPEAVRAAEGIEIVRLVRGGSERQHSIASALEAVGADIPIILVHDAARPAVSRELIERVVASASEHGAAIPVMPLSETVKRVDEEGWVIETIPRETLRSAQTPQGFRRETIIAAYARAASAGILGTDDSSLVEAAGLRVQTIPGESTNIKLTLPEDFERMAVILEAKIRGGEGP